MDSTIFERLNAQDWDYLSVKLLRYALMKVRRLGWATGSGENPNLPNGMSAEDLACQAITRVFEGTRSWNPDKEPDLFKFLCDVVDSLVSHLVNSEEHKERKNQVNGDFLHDYPDHGDPGDGRGGRGRVSDFQVAEPGHDGGASPAERFFYLAIEALSDDPDLFKVFELCYDGMDKAADIARSMGIPVDQVYRLKEKMRRRLAKLQVVLKEGERV
jgi:DNA-directed RNA polymerase specialized sigma24 family protein